MTNNDNNDVIHINITTVMSRRGRRPAASSRAYSFIIHMYVYMYAHIYIMYTYRDIP